MILFISIFYIYLIYRSMESLHMLQQNLYNENNRYMKWVLKNSERVFNIYDFIPIIFFAFLFFIKDKSIIDFTLIASFFIYLYCIYYEYKINKDNQNKIPLKSTNRIKRIFITILLLYTIPVIGVIILKKTIYLPVMLILLIIMLVFLYYVTYIALIINMPIDKVVTYIYRRRAINKLNSFNNLKVIGITGSYGKTSSKQILNDILSSKYICKPTPKNYNTYKGTMITINNYLDKFDEIFISEMGAYQKGDIKEICDLVKPKYAILTKIGECHLESFKSIENIQNTKFELIESLEENGLCILNLDDELQTSYKIKNNVRVKWISLDNKDADYYASDIKFNSHGMSFVCHYQDNSIKLNTKLLGKHNIYNILASIALSIEFGIGSEDIINSVASLKAVEHRLELKKLGNFYQLDDAYNSNPVGANNALEVLKMMDGDRVVVTPGMIELGKIEDEENYKFGYHMAECTDYVLLIGKNRTKNIYKGLIDNGFDKDNIFILNNVVDSFKFINSLVRDKKMYALYENDLPDIYTEGE